MCDIPKDLPKTTALVRVYLPRDLAHLVVKYMMSPYRYSWRNIAEGGEYEICLLIPEKWISSSLSDACYGGHEEIIDLLLQSKITDWGLVFSGAAGGNNKRLAEMAIANGVDGSWWCGLRSACIHWHKQMVEYIVSHVPEKYRDDCFYETGIEHALINGHEEIALSLLGRGFNDYNHYLTSACYGGCANLIDLLISHGGNNWNHSLYDATTSGHYDLAELMISYGANNWNEGLRGSASHGSIKFVLYMISKGANNWNEGLNSACRGGHLEIAKLMIAHGANNWNEGLKSACVGGHKKIAKLMISHGANDWDNGAQHAWIWGKKDLIKLMINHGASCPIKCGSFCNGYSGGVHETFCEHSVQTNLKN